ncbi:NACHT domain-containing protein [Tumidithrix elongata RA019]|uniref:NACHT domain-containing protein n=1 Tax=Tumidithrix elongata BACA0141 TaxID=2716417 RepID=A0AAW9PPX6_9CYAN|nr:NACHT domain-containing protein [Tumidithrix elongata RA019]
MLNRSLTATEIGIHIARKALIGKALSQKKFAEELDIALATVSNFFTGKPVDRQFFVQICNALDLEWEEVTGQKIVSSINEKENDSLDIDALVQLARERCEADIRKRCGIMHVLSMSQEIGLGDIYTDVRFFKQSSIRQFLTEEEYLKEVGTRDWEQYGYAGLELKKPRIDGLKAVSQAERLMILGRPGSGKTTFLKYLAIMNNAGEFEPDHATIFVTLQYYAGENGSLIQFIDKQWEACDINTPNALESILRAGRALVLLDGLDEVLRESRMDMIREIESFANTYEKTRIVVTCRIAAEEYIFPRFKVAQVAEFDEAQIRSFVEKWFANDIEKSNQFFAKLNERPRINHQAPNPLLLTLLCLIFAERNDFYESRALLYEKGIELLMERWDNSRSKKRDEIYKRLSTQRKEEMLSQLAFETFQENLLVFRRDRAANTIAEYIKDLRYEIGDREALLTNGREILTSIESQHGLLTQRFDGFYSFSHLTFHEYLTAYEIVRVRQSSPKVLAELISHLNDKKWREVFLLSVEMSPKNSANVLLIGMKDAIDNILTGDENLQIFLQWIDEKSRSVNEPYKPVAIRAYYFYLALSRALALHKDLNLAEDFKKNFKFICVLDRNYDLDHIKTQNLDYTLDRVLAAIRQIIHNLQIVCDRSRSDDIAWVVDSIRKFKSATDIALKMNKISNYSELYNQLENLQIKARDLSQNWNDDRGSCNLWKEEWKELAEKLKEQMIKSCNIGREFQFTSTQIDELHKYHLGNQFLVECLNTECLVSRETRQQIEDELLLPIASLRHTN